MALLFVACAPNRVYACDDPLARRFVPEALAIADVRADTSRVRCAAQPLPALSTPLLAVAYTNGDVGAFVVIKGAGNSARSVYSLTRAGMLGDLPPELEVADLDGDSSPEVIASYYGAGGDVRSVWVFKIDNDQIRSITPLDPDDSELSLLENTVFVDFDGDGRRDAISITPSVSDSSMRDLDVEVRRNTNTGFEATPQRLVFAALLFCGKSESTEVQEAFVFHAADRTGTLRIINGIAGEGVRKAALSLNDKSVVVRNLTGTRRVEMPIVLRNGRNTLAGKLHGPSGSGVAVLIY